MNWFPELPVAVRQILSDYATLLQQGSERFGAACSAYPEDIRCGRGCSGCCRGLFDITLLDALTLRAGFEALPSAERAEIAAAAAEQLVRLSSLWPDFALPFILNTRPDTDWELLMPEADESPCVFLSGAGDCRVYQYRPMTCRLHGFPLVELNGELIDEGWCTENFTDSDPLQLSALRAPYMDLFRGEVRLTRRLTQQLLAVPLNELDTLIPCVPLVDYGRFDWRAWWERTSIVLNDPVE